MKRYSVNVRHFRYGNTTGNNKTINLHTTFYYSNPKATFLILFTSIHTEPARQKHQHTDCIYGHHTG